MKKNTKKLQLKREHIRALTHKEASQVHGGLTNTLACPTSFCTQDSCGCGPSNLCQSRFCTLVICTQ